MKTTTPLIVMVAFCLNLSYGQEKQKCSMLAKPSRANSLAVKPKNSAANQPYKYDFSGFRSGYKSGYRISNDDFMKGKSIIVRNYTITQLFALALRLNVAKDNSTEKS